MSEQQQRMFDETDQLQQLLNNLERLPEDDLKDIWPATLQTLYQLTIDELEKQGVNGEQARKLAPPLIVRQAHYMGGRTIYLPRNDKLKKAIRDAEIFRRFKGHNHRQLAAEYDLTDASIYIIVAEQLALEKARRQLGLGF